MKVIFLPNWLLPFGNGLTLWKLVLINKTTKNIPYVIMHEYCHVLQWQKAGFFKFIYLYFKELYNVGYWNNKYEISAREYGILHQDEYKNYR